MTDESPSGRFVSNRFPWHSPTGNPRNRGSRAEAGVRGPMLRVPSVPVTLSRGDGDVLEADALGERCATSVDLRLGDFAWTHLREEADRQGVSVEDLAAHAVVYYLADADSGRTSWPVPRLPGHPAA